MLCKRDIDTDGVEITDQQAAIFALAFYCDFLFLDAPNSTARLVTSDGETRYLDETSCIRMVQSRKNDLYNDPLNIIMYTPGHYEGVRFRG